MPGKFVEWNKKQPEYWFFHTLSSIYTLIYIEGTKTGLLAKMYLTKMYLHALNNPWRPTKDQIRSRMEWSFLMIEFNFSVSF